MTGEAMHSASKQWSPVILYQLSEKVQYPKCFIAMQTLLSRVALKI